MDEETLKRLRDKMYSDWYEIKDDPVKGTDSRASKSKPTATKVIDNKSDLLKKALSSTKERVKILQFNKEGNLVGVYNSLSQASVASGVLMSGISKVINLRAKSAGGFVWKRIKL